MSKIPNDNNTALSPLYLYLHNGILGNTNFLLKREIAKYQKALKINMSVPNPGASFSKNGCKKAARINKAKNWEK